MVNKPNNVIYLDRTAREKQERKAMEAQRRRIQKRQSIGDPAIPANDNEDFPLLAVLRRDKLYHYIEVVMEYRRLVAISEAEALKGQDYGYDAGFYAAQESRRMKGIEEVDKAAAEGWKENIVAGGDIEYTGKIRKSRGAYSLPATQKQRISVDAYFEGENGGSKVSATGRTASLHFKMTDELLIERIDTAPLLAHLRAALGPLLEPFEDAVLGGQTFADIGAKEGFKSRSASEAGKALVFRGLSAVSGAVYDSDMVA
ncbi:hypothetical protein [Paenochrobactrum pullorum]|uniref:hypothetical protein n=1 Tax=Paenochrobactrum pullorum TaxID=1324351 RepID=UPI0035BBB923